MEKGPKVEQAMMDAVAPPEEVADVAVFLSSPLSAGINGQNILTDRGMRLAVHAFAGVFELPEFKPL
jgi:enoyl-[acyl-carrier-protein] reductase (NADH)